MQRTANFWRVAGGRLCIRALELLQNCTHEILEMSLNLRQYVHFQHDGAPPHNERQVTEWLTETYGRRWVEEQSVGHHGPRTIILWISLYGVT